VILEAGVNTMSTTFDKAIISVPFKKSTDQPEEDSPFVGFIEGYASTSDLDREDDIITPKALQAASGDLVAEGTNAVYFNHRHDKLPIGLVLKSAYQHSKGIFVKIGIIVKEYWKAIKDGRLTSLSIYGRFKSEPKFQEVDTEDGKINARMINKVSLYEVSVVTIPANPAAKFSVVAKNFLAEQKDNDAKMIAKEQKPVGEIIVPENTFDEEKYKDEMLAKIKAQIAEEQKAEEEAKERIQKEAEKEAQIEQLIRDQEELKELITKGNKGQFYQEPDFDPPVRSTTPGTGETSKSLEEVEYDEFMTFIKILTHPGEVYCDVYAPTGIKLPANMASWNG
jgi:HK97 family phage prohead protease